MSMHIKPHDIDLHVTLIYVDPLFDHKIVKQRKFRSATKINQLRTSIEAIPQDKLKIVVLRHEKTGYVRSLRYKPDIIDELFKFMMYVPV